MIVPYEIAVKLKQLGFSKEVYRSYWLESKELTPFYILDNYNRNNSVVSAPTVSEALQDIRERYRVICAVDVDYFDGWYYTGKYLFMGETEFKHTESFDDHPEAELSLLKQVVEYLREKER